MIWTKNYIVSDIDGNTTFKLINTKLQVYRVTLATKINVKITKHINKGSKRSAYWNEYKTKTESKKLYIKNPTRFHLDGSFQGVKSLFVLFFDNTNNDAKKVQRDTHKQ